MSQPSLNTTPLFQTSLRSWQANFKASKEQAAGPDAGLSRATAAPRRPRLGLLQRRARVRN